MSQQEKNRKLTIEDLKTARCLRRGRLSLKSIACLYEVSESTISAALRGKTYADVDPAGRLTRRMRAK